MTEKEQIETGCEQAEAAAQGRAEGLNEEIRAWEDKYLRVRAEYDNFRKRTQKERESFYALATAEAIGAFIPVIDNMERACAAEAADEGVRMIFKQLMSVLECYHVETVGQAGERFDPKLHEAVSHEGDGGESHIETVLKKGYRIGDRLIRPAMVKTVS